MGLALRVCYQLLDCWEVHRDAEWEYCLRCHHFPGIPPHHFRAKQPDLRRAHEFQTAHSPSRSGGNPHGSRAVGIVVAGHRTLCLLLTCLLDPQKRFSLKACPVLVSERPNRLLTVLAHTWIYVETQNGISRSGSYDRENRANPSRFLLLVRDSRSKGWDFMRRSTFLLNPCQPTRKIKTA